MAILGPPGRGAKRGVMQKKMDKSISARRIFVESTAFFEFSKIRVFINRNFTEVSQKNKCFCSKYIKNSQLIFFFKANDITIINPSAGIMISGVCRIIKSSCFPPNISNVCFTIFLQKNESSCYYQENLEKICLKKIYQITKS